MPKPHSDKRIANTHNGLALAALCRESAARRAQEHLQPGRPGLRAHAQAGRPAESFRTPSWIRLRVWHAHAYRCARMRVYVGAHVRMRGHSCASALSCPLARALLIRRRRLVPRAPRGMYNIAITMILILLILLISLRNIVRGTYRERGLPTRRSSQCCTASWSRRPPACGGTGTVILYVFYYIVLCYVILYSNMTTWHSAGTWALSLQKEPMSCRPMPLLV